MYHKTVLENGLRIISEQLDHLKSVSLGIWVNAGSRDEEPEQNGISHFIEHMVFKGTHNRSTFQIAKELDSIGGMSNAFTAKENTCFHARVLGKHFDRLADILSDIFLHSLFDPLDMERERQVILQEISMVEDSPDENVHVLLNRRFWEDHPLGLPILGTNETVAAIQKETIVEYMGRSYGPENVIVSAAGNIQHETLVSYLRPLFEELEPGGVAKDRVPPRSNSGISCQEKDHEQVHLCLGAEAPSMKDDRRYACALFNVLLGGNMSSRLFQEIREKRGLAYSVYSFHSAYCDSGMFGVYLATDNGNINPALETIQNEIRKIQEGDVTTDDLVAAKEHLVGGIYLSSENPDNRMMRIAKNEMVFHRYVSYEELVGRMEKVTIDEIVAIAEDIFRKGKVFVATLGPFSREMLDAQHLQF
ncbi:MAG: insulinase family protein [Deltaproteobacteria bacterium]|nr:insulinase family protein [Deltaproteobacteria bacterium]